MLGSNGEYPALTSKEKTSVLESVAKEVHKNIPTKAARKTLIAGTGSNSTYETIEITKVAASQGYDAALVRIFHLNFVTRFTLVNARSLHHIILSHN